MNNRKKLEKLAIPILLKCSYILGQMKDEFRALYWDENFKRFTWAPAKNHKLEKITESASRLKMLGVIIDHFNRYGRVIVYYCPDNAELSFETPTAEEFSNDIEPYDYRLTNYKIPFYLIKD